ncbi:MAG TPA: hypothetical protein PLS49_06275 [Candidatus Woesebacteria bacterium]|nr:hypothetical protein [Candidatus Woesebacteria bacterium]
MSQLYPRGNPHWVQADDVQAATADNMYVNIRVGDEEFRMHRVEWHDPFFNKSKSDVLVQNSEGNWLRVWFFNKDIQPFNPQ